MLLSVSAGAPYKTLQDVIAAAKASPGKLSYASGGNGTPPHLSAAIFTEKTGIQMVHVPYKGSGPALVDVMSGQIAMIIDTAASVTPHMRRESCAASRSRASGAGPTCPKCRRSPRPGSPITTRARGTPIHAPAGTPKDIIAKLNASWRAS